MRSDALLAAIADRLVETDGGCLLFRGPNGGLDGYVRIRGRRRPVNSVIYELLHGGIPRERVLLKSCGEPRCCNLDHLRVGHVRDAVLRGESASARNARAVACPRGHRYTKKNTYIDPAGARHCRACGREHYHETGKERRRRRREAARAAA